MQNEFDRLFAFGRASPFDISRSPLAMPQEQAAGTDVVGQQGFALDQQPFGPAYTRAILSGFYNGDFATAPTLGAGIGTLPKYVLPYWSASGSAHNMSMNWRADATVASGATVRMTIISGNSVAGDDIYLEQLIPLLSSVTARWTYSVVVYGKCVSIVGTPKMRTVYDWLKNDKVTTTGAGATQDTAMVAATTQSNIIAPVTPPVDAAYMRVRIGAHAAANNDGCVFDYCDIARLIA